MTTIIFYVFLLLPIIWYLLPRGASRKTTFAVIYTIVYLLLIGGARNIETGNIADSTYPLFGISLIYAVLGVFHGIYRLIIERSRRKESQENQNESAVDDWATIAAVPAEKVNVMTADIRTLSNLPGLGIMRIRKIQLHLESGGRFGSFEEFADFLDLKEFERSRLSRMLTFPDDTVEEQKSEPEKKPTGRVIDF